MKQLLLPHPVITEIIAVIRGEDDHGFFGLAGLLQPIEQPAEMIVDLLDQPHIGGWAALTLNKTVTPLNDNYELPLHARPTAIQDKAFELLGIKPERTQQTTVADMQNCVRSSCCAHFE